MAGYVDLLLKESVGILGEMQRRFLQRVSANTSRLSGMIEDLVRVWAVDSGSIALTFEPLELLALAEETITDLSTALREKNIEVVLEADDDLPAVRGDAEVLRQVLRQVLSNAYLATPQSGRIVVALASKSDPEPSLLMKVTDSGKGVRPGEEEQAFELRYQGENPLMEGLGDTGVGMALARALVSLHDGEIWLEAAQPRGTQVSLLLPTV
jgi:signal transduction histidine kinase